MKILIVEDDPLIAQTLQAGLEELYLIDIAADGETGLQKAESSCYDLLILDQVLPGIHGTEVCKELRLSGVETPILMLTQKQTIQDKINGFDAGADDYLGKPFHFAELKARINSLVRRPKTIQPPTYHCGPLTLDTARQQVSVHQQPIKLSKKEFFLLEYLLRNKNRVLTKEMILDRFWEKSSMNSNSLEVYIKRIRDKIKTKSNLSLIKNIHGVGYILTSKQ